LNIVDIDFTQQDYIVDSKKIEMFTTILQLLLLIEAKEEEEEEENVKLLFTTSRSLSLRTTAQVVDCLYLLDARGNID